MRIPPSNEASQSTEFHDIRQHRQNSSPPQDTDVPDTMKGLDYGWNRSNSYYTQDLNGDYARLSVVSAHHQPTQPTPISPWNTFNHLQHTNQPPPLITDMNFQSSIPSNLSSEFSGISPGSVTQTMSSSQMAYYPSLETTYSRESVGSHGGTSGSISSSYSNRFTPVGEEDRSKRHSIASISVDSDSAASPTLATRGRRSSFVEPGSARAVYLEKNRHAARKCRTKQKKHQEVLVEAARDMERKNKQLKAEVEFLRGDMRDLMGLIFQHGSCPDQRLSRYVQREADRLGAQNSSNHSPKMEALESPPMASASSPEMV